MGFEQILFWLLAVGAIVTSALVVLPPTGKNPLYGALLLIVSFFFTAGIFILLFAHTMAILQILVYAGAIMVLFTFVIMLLNLSRRELGDETRTIAKGVGVAGVAVLGVKTILMLDAQVVDIPGQPVPAGFGGVDAIADLLFKSYLIPFELTGLLLLVAVIGAVVLAKRTL